MQRKTRFIAAALPAVLLLAGCSNGVLDPAGPVGRDDAQILIDSTLIMLAIVIPTILLAFWMAWKYRASNDKAQYLPNWSYSGRIEAVVWAIPTLTIMLIGGVIWIGSFRLDPFRPLASKTPAVDVEVVSLDWKWLFVYPDLKIASVNELAFPAGTPVHFRLTSGSVMNAFFVPQLGTMIYTMAGMETQLSLSSEHMGTFDGISSNFSGEGFSDMKFFARSMSDDDFQSWVEHARAGGAVLSSAVYHNLEKPSEKVPVAYYGDIDPMVFHEALGMMAMSSASAAPAAAASVEKGL